MCEFDHLDEGGTLLSEGKRRARKPHRCAECWRTIVPGERYHYTVAIFDGALHTWKCCAHCFVVSDWLVYQCGGFIFEGVRNDVANHLDEIRDPRVLGWLVRAVLGMGRQWRREDGAGLRDIPGAWPDA